MPLPSTHVVDSRIAAHLAAYFNSVCSIFATIDTRNSVGEVVRSRGQFPLTGHEAIACNRALAKGVRYQETEQRTATSTFVRVTYEAMLDSYYPQIQDDFVAVIDDIAYDIRGVIHVSQHTHTKLILEIIESDAQKATP